MEQLTPHFTLAEFLASKTADVRKIKNEPNAKQLEAIKVCARGLEEVRTNLNKPVTILSGFRCDALNRAVGGVDDGAHELGYAADITVVGYTPEALTEALRNSGIKFDQVIWEPTWVHISFDPRMRQQLLKATKNSSGKMQYTNLTK